MKVLKKPDVSGWSKRVTCKNCRARLEVEFADLELVGMPANAAVFKCAVCGHTEEVPRDKLPAKVWAMMGGAS